MTTLQLTLAEYAADPDPLVAGVAKALREESKLFDIIPFADVGTLAVKTYHETGMAQSVAWRKVGDNHGSVKGPMPKEVQEMGYSIGNEIQVDYVYMQDKAKRLVDPFTFQTKMITKGIARGFNDKFINGKPEDLLNPVGIRYRVMTDCPTTQRITADPAGASAGLDISYDATATNYQYLIDKLDALLYAVNGSLDAGGRGVYFLTNDAVIMRVNSGFRQSGLLQTTTDALGRIWMEYKGARFVDVGYKDDETDVAAGTRIMLTTEPIDGTYTSGTNTGSSIYAVKIGREDLTGWQEYAMRVLPPVLDPVHQLQYTAVIDWYVGLALSNYHSIARLYGLITA